MDQHHWNFVRHQLGAVDEHRGRLSFHSSSLRWEYWAMLKQKGQTLVMFALVMALFMTFLIIVTIDLQFLSVTLNRADNAALLGAQAGATAVDPGSIYSAQLGSSIALKNVPTTTLTSNPSGQTDSAQYRCYDAIKRIVIGGATFDPATSCTLSNGNTTVTVHVIVDLRLPIGVPGYPAVLKISPYADRTARAAFGGCPSGQYNFNLVTGLCA
jgi:hypothetical protein